MTRSAIACAFFFLSFHATAQTYLSCDFEKGIPADFILKDYDKNTPSASMRQLGFSVGTPWVAMTPNKNSANHAAASTSWYSPAGTSDDWLITPAVTLSGSNPELIWKAAAYDAKHADGYAVYIMTVNDNSKAGSDVEKTDFDTSAPLFSTASESATWQEHILSLAEYAGKTVRVAFVNNSTDCSRLFIDDITLQEHHSVSLNISLPTAVNYTGDAAVSGTVSTRSGQPINGFTIGVEADGETTTEHFDMQLTAAEPVKFTTNRKFTLGKHQTQRYKVWVEADGEKVEEERSVTTYPQAVVCEEGTGTWCGWCVRGLAMLDSIRNNFKGKVIGIAAHSGDVMQSDYVSNLSRNDYIGSDFPSGSVNRRMKCDPSKFLNYASIILSNPETLCDINLELDFDRATRSVSTSTVLHFAEDHNDCNFALSYVITENKVHKPGDDQYRQHNSYANGENGVMGGYEKYGEYIPSEVMYFNDVARGFEGDFLGIDGSIPNSLKAEEAVEDKRTFTLPANILVDDNVEITVLLLDKTDGKIINAQSRELVAHPTDGIQTVTLTAQSASTIYTIGGIRTNSMLPGINIIHTADGKTLKVAK